MNALIPIVNADVANKFGVHKTVHPSLKRQINEIGEIPGVDRVILGPSKGVRHNRPVGSLKLQTDVPTGIRMVGYSDRGISEFTVITSKAEAVRREIERRFSMNKPIGYAKGSEEVIVKEIEAKLEEAWNSMTPKQREIYTKLKKRMSLRVAPPVECECLPEMETI